MSGRREIGARQVLMEVGGNIFGFPEIAEEALERGEEEVESAWKMFIELLDAYDLLAVAFENAWPSRGVVPAAIKRGLSEQDAEDVSQSVAIAAWKQIYRYKPWLASWSTWIMAISKNLILNFIRDNSKDMDTEPLREYEPAREDTDITVDMRPEALRALCVSWIECGDPARREFARTILNMYDSGEVFGLTSTQMVESTGLSKAKCYRLFHEFIMEASSLLDSMSSSR